MCLLPAPLPTPHDTRWAPINPYENPLAALLNPKSASGQRRYLKGYPACEGGGSGKDSGRLGAPGPDARCPRVNVPRPSRHDDGMMDWQERNAARMQSAAPWISSPIHPLARGLYELLHIRP